MDFSKHRLSSWAWRETYRKEMGDEAFDAYFLKVWCALDLLKENEYYNIETQVRPEFRDLFIKICCQYVLTHNNYEFSDDYTKIICREQIVIMSAGMKKNKCS